MIFGGLILAGVGAFIMAFPGEFELPLAQAADLENFDISPEVHGPIFFVSGVFALGLGIAFILAAYGAFAGKVWAWLFNVILAWIIIATNAGSIALGHQDPASELIGSTIFITIAAVILHYLYRPHLKTFFGRAEPPIILSPGSATI